MDAEDSRDPVTLATEFVQGQNLKRSVLVEMVGDLLQLIDELQHVQPSAKVICTSATTSDAPCGVPMLEGYDAKPPIKVQNGAAGSVYLGPESNRYYTRSEAVALAGAIARAAAVRVGG